MKKSFLIVEDEALIREGLRSLLEKEEFVRTIYEASNAKEFKIMMQNDIDLILLDFRLCETNGLELLSVLNKEIRPKVIVITGLEGTELIMNLLRWGVHGIVYKLDGYKEIRKTIIKVIEGDSYYSDRVKNIIQANAYKWDYVPPVNLTFGEMELLKAIASGLITKEIAIKLKMSESTAETYRLRLIKKVNVHNTAGLLAYAYRNGIL